MFVDFFIKRPVFATVCSIIILLLGAIAIPTLPIAQYPEISPIQVNVTANYIGADAQTVEETVTTLLEQEINGVEGMRYISSSSSNDGTSNISVTFDAGTDQDIAAVDVQNRVSLAEPRLPETVRQTGVTITKQSSSLLLAMSLYTDNNEYDNIFLSNYADLYMVDAIRRIEGVGNVRIFGERTYAMRLWLDPRQLASRNLTAEDVADALEEQNIEVGAGRIGQQPALPNQQYQIDIRALSRLESAEDFEGLIVGTAADGSPIELRDVGRVELGAENYNGFLRFRGQDAIGLGIYQLPDSNALDVARAVKSEIERLSQQFPPNMKYGVGFDTTEFVEASLTEVAITLIQAVVLVILIIFIFLQDWRTTIIPAVTIPLALIGTFAFVRAFNFSLNSLTLFGLTLASGVVVDDAIVVVEDISKKIQDEGLRPVQASIQAMRELTGAVIATSLVLMAVFVPVAFFPGTTGALYRQFALTIAFSIVISTFNALTLTPSLAALLLRRREPRRGWLGKIFNFVNRILDGMRDRYRRSLEFIKNFKAIVIGLFIVSLGLTGWLYITTPSAFLPDEDQGYFLTIIQGPEGVSLNYTDKVMRRVEAEILKIPQVRATFAVGGFSFSGSTANSGIIFTNLIPWDERKDSSQTAQAIIANLQQSLGGITEARVLPVNPPAIRGLGSFGGFQFQLQDRRGNLPLNDLVANMNKLIASASQNPDLQAVFSTYAANTPQLLVEVNRRQAKSLGVNIDDIFSTLQAYLGSQYVNDFIFEGRNYRVYIQADRQFRSNPQDIQRLYVRSENDRMIPLGNLVTVTSATGAQTINHYNLFRSIEINGQAAEGASSGDAIQAMQQVASQVLPASLGYEWTGTALDELESGSQAPIIFALGLLFVFLVLAAQYESYIDPIIIMLAVPLAIFGALAAQTLRGFPNDVYCQIGLVMLIGLASKNSILIVEFANQLREQGQSITNAAIKASEQRLRPILMTAISTLVGIFPLVIAVGAGAGSRQSLGTAVFGGMLVATFLSLFITPVLYIVIKQLSDRFLPAGKNKKKDDLDSIDSVRDGNGRLVNSNISNN
jgi:hydrophobic/amphiphilic exporter-1 (mainly G- bacteria), HAE1 family